LWRRLRGHPLRLLQVAGMLSEGVPAAELWALARDPDPERAVGQRGPRRCSPTGLMTSRGLRAALLSEGRPWRAVGPLWDSAPTLGSSCRRPSWNPFWASPA
jgi:hypothetical protein